MKRGTVTIGYCHPGTVSGLFTHSLVNLVARSIQRIRGQVAYLSGPMVHKARNTIVRQFLDGDAEWLLMLDSDMVFPPDMLDNLLESAHWKDRPIVSALCWGADPMSSSVFPTMYKVTDDGVARFIVETYEGMVPVDATGAAALLVHRTVYEKLQDEYDGPNPWYAYAVYDGQEVGEDVTFCLRARAAGYPIFVNCDVETGHHKAHVIGWKPYG